MKKMIFYRPFFCVIVLCLTFNLAFASEVPKKPNILMILIDDYGVDKSPLYSDGGIEIAPTPAIDRLAKEGIQFMNAWTAPNCMATRAQIITGQFGFRTGVLNAAPQGQNIDEDNPSLLPKLLREKAGYATAKIGKYQLHTGGDNARATLAIKSGYDYFFGNGAGYPPDRAYLATDGQGPDPDDAIGADYFIPVLARFQRCSRGPDENPLPWQEPANINNECGFLENKPPVGDVAGRTDPTTLGIVERIYSTTWDVNEAIAWIEKQDGPWFMNLSFQATHAPFVYPPENLVDPDIVDALKALNGGVYDQGKLAKATTDPAVDDKEARLVYAAMMSAVDTETGRLLKVLRDPDTGELENTIVIILGDNGTPSTVVAFDPDAATKQPDQVNELRSKSSYYEGGVNVPFIVAGLGIKHPGRKEDALISTTDLFTTALDWAGVDLDEITPYATGPIDGVSFARVLEQKNFKPTNINYTEIAHMRIPPTRPTPNNPPPLNIFGVYEGSAIRDKRYKMIWKTRYAQPRFVSASNLTGAPICPTPEDPNAVCEWSCVDGSEFCGYLERVKQIEFYDLKKDPHEMNNLMANGIPTQHFGILKQLAGELEDLLDVEVVLEYEQDEDDED
jgi:arylsulfatase A-like enzyme